MHKVRKFEAKLLSRFGVMNYRISRRMGGGGGGEFAFMFQNRVMVSDFGRLVPIFKFYVLFNNLLKNKTLTSNWS